MMALAVLGLLGGGAAGVCRAEEPLRVQGDTLAGRLAAHPLELLVGRVPGVEVVPLSGTPGAEPGIYVRGLRVSAGLRPIYLVDGVRVTDLGMVSSEDIARIEVLTDPSAFSDYGPEAANGVVVVTTRRASRQGLHAGYRVEAAAQSLAGFPEPLSAEDWAGMGFDRSGRGYDLSDLTETAWVHQHHAYLQYADDRWSAYAAWSYLGDDGPYKAGEDTQRRHTGTYALAYRALPWLRMEMSGHFGRSRIHGAPDYLQSAMSRGQDDYEPDRYRNSTSRTSFSGRTLVEACPWTDLRLQVSTGYVVERSDSRILSWQDPVERNPWVGAEWDRPSRRWLEGRGEAEYVHTFPGGHRLEAGASFQMDRNRMKYRTLGGRAEYGNHGIADGDDDAVLALLEQEYGKYAEDWMDYVLSSDAVLDASQVRWYDSDTRRAAETLHLGYGWKGRYTLAAGYYHERGRRLGGFRTWTCRTPSASVGWTLTEEPWVRRVLPAGWSRLAVTAQWAQTGTYFPLLAEDVSNSGRAGLLSADARHRSLRLESGWQGVAGTLSLSAERFVDDDDAEDQVLVSYTGPGGTSHWPVAVLSGLRNEGWTFAGDWHLASGDWRFSASGNVTLYKDRVSLEDMERVVSLPVGSAGHGRQLGRVDGEPYGVYLPLYLYDGVDAGTGMGRYTENGIDGWTYLGGIMPKVGYGLRLGFSWREWALDVSGHGRSGGHILHDGSVDALLPYYLADSWTEEHPDARYPLRGGIGSHDFLYSDAALFDGSFFKVDRIRLSYAVPALSRWHLPAGAVRLHASLENGILSTSYPGSDPEAALAWGRLGTESGLYPAVRRWVFGVSVDF